LCGARAVRSAQGLLPRAGLRYLLPALLCAGPVCRHPRSVLLLSLRPGGLWRRLLCGGLRLPGAVRRSVCRPVCAGLCKAVPCVPDPVLPRSAVQAGDGLLRPGVLRSGVWL
jgi:hypothetical protein